MTETSSNVLSIQGEQTGGAESAYLNFTGTNAELTGKLPGVGDEQTFTIRAVCKKAGNELVDDTVRPFRTMKVVEVSPGEITDRADVDGPTLFDDASEG